LLQTLDFQRRMLNCFARGVEQRRRHLSQLARVLPRAEQLFAAPRQRLDAVSDKLRPGLSQNLAAHRIRLSRTEAALRPGLLRRRLAQMREQLEALQARALRCERAGLKEGRAKFETLARLLDGVSYRKVLERGFALVRGEDGQVRRRAAALKPGESLTLTFADGDTPATAGGTAKSRGKKTPIDQGSLF
jgi:exodeoxyribonuclease VII large subunit